MQAVIIWILSSGDDEATVKAVTGAADSIHAALKGAGVAVKLDDRDNYAPGWKYNHWEQKVPSLSLRLLAVVSYRP